MAFAITSLSVLAYANGFTLWHYKAGAASRRDAASAGFFDEAADLLAKGDMLMVSAADGAALMCVADTAAGRITLDSVG